jgi:hypothetical protein
VFDTLGVVAHNSVCSFGYRDRALGVLPERQTWNPENGCLFLDAAAVGEN